MPAVSTCNKQTAAAVARPQAQKWMPLTWDMYVLFLQLNDDCNATLHRVMINSVVSIYMQCNNQHIGIRPKKLMFIYVFK